MSNESWQQNSFESDDEKKSDSGERPVRLPRFENLHVLNIANPNEGHIPLHETRPPKSLFEGLVKQETDSTDDEKDDDVEEDDSVVPLPQAASTSLASEKLPVDQSAEESADLSTDAPATPVSANEPTWRPAPLPSIESSSETVDPAAFAAEFEPEFEPPALRPRVLRRVGASEEPVAEKAASVFPELGHRPIEDYEEPAASGSEGSEASSSPFSPSSGGESASFDGAPEASELEEPNVAPTGSSGGGGYGGGSRFGGGSGFGPAFANTASAAFGAAAKTAEAAANLAANMAEQRGLRRGLIAGFITGYALKAYLANRKLKRFQKETNTAFKQRDEKITQLQSEQQRLHEQTTRQAEEYKRQQRFEQMANSNQPAARFEGSAANNIRPVVEAKPAQAISIAELPPIAPGPAEQIVELDGEQIVLPPGHRLERRGWYSVVVNERGEEVPGILPRGELFHHEQKEHLRGALADDKAPTTAGGDAYAADQTQVQSVAPMLGSGQADVRHELPASAPPPLDVWHRLPKPKTQNPLVATVKSPWLWAGIAAILIAYFTAALT